MSFEPISMDMVLNKGSIACQPKDNTTHLSRHALLSPIVDNAMVVSIQMFQIFQNKNIISFNVLMF